MATTPIINAQLDTLNDLMRQQNASLAILASDKYAEGISNINTLSQLIRNGELLHAMDYGDQIVHEWSDGTNTYDAPMNLCQVSSGTLETQEEIPTAIFEWEYTLPFGTAFCAPQALYESSNTLPAGTYNFSVANATTESGDNGKTFQFTLTNDLPAGYQIRKSANANSSLTSGILNIYSSGASLDVAYSVVVTEGNSGTSLGVTDGSGDLNHFSRCNYGHNRWKTSDVRQYLNSSAAAGSWWTQQEKWGVMPSWASSQQGFLAGYDAAFVEHMQGCQVITQANSLTDSSATDTTYDKVFLHSLEQMYVSPQASISEGTYWEYYKRLLGATSPVARSQTYARLKKYALNVTTSAQNCWTRSASTAASNSTWLVYSSGVITTTAASYGYRCAPACRIG